MLDQFLEEKEWESENHEHKEKVQPNVIKQGILSLCILDDRSTILLHNLLCDAYAFDGPSVAGHVAWQDKGHKIN